MKFSAGPRTGQQLFLHDVDGHAPARGDRALPLAGRDDLVCVAGEVDPAYLRYLAELELGPAPENIIVAGCGLDGPLAERIAGAIPALERIAARLSPTGDVALHARAGTAGVFALAEALERLTGRSVPVLAARPELTRRVNDRHRMRDEAIELEIPVPEGEVARLAFAGGRRRRDLEPLRVAVERQLCRTGRVLVRGSSDESGCSTYVVGRGADDTDELLRKLALRTDNLVYLVEVLVEATSSPNIQLVIEPDSGEIRCLGITDQRWVRGLTRVGHAQPSGARAPEPMLEWSGRLADRLRQAGYVGPLSLDFVEYREDDAEAPRSFLAGVAPVMDESAYAVAIRERLGGAAFVSGMLTSHSRSFNELRQALGGLLYHPGSESGVVPYDTGALAQGRCPVVALGASRLQAAELLAKAQSAAGG